MTVRLASVCSVVLMSVVYDPSIHSDKSINQIIKGDHKQRKADLKSDFKDKKTALELMRKDLVAMDKLGASYSLLPKDIKAAMEFRDHLAKEYHENGETDMHAKLIVSWEC